MIQLDLDKQTSRQLFIYIIQNDHIICSSQIQHTT